MTIKRFARVLLCRVLYRVAIWSLGRAKVDRELRRWATEEYGDKLTIRDALALIGVKP